jgi:hypothetical protein
MNKFVNEMSEEESFSNVYYYFMEALRVLAENAENQCKIMGSYNVAWEIKDDVSRGSYLIDKAEGKISVGKRKAIVDLLTDLNTIPESVLAYADSEIANKNAMNHPCWNNLRSKATNLIKLLNQAG